MVANNGRVLMVCAGAPPERHSSFLYDAALPGNPNAGSGPHQRWVPFFEALHRPPTCHGVPLEAIGAVRMRRLTERFRETGRITAECEVSYGFEQAAWCHAHGWSGRASEVDSDHRCPHHLLAAWIVRRHAASPALAEGEQW